MDEVSSIVRERVQALKEGEHMKETWIQRGLLFGVMLGIIHIVYDLLINLLPANVAVTHFLNNSIVVVVLVFIGIASYSTARTTGKMTTGIYAGFFTGILSIVIDMSALFLITFLFMDVIRQNAFMLSDFHHSGLKSINEFIIEDAMGAAFVGTLFSVIAGALFGTLTGFLGVAFR